MTSSNPDENAETLDSRKLTAEEQFYLETAYKEPVESIKRIEETARFLVGAVATTSGLLVAALKVSVGTEPLGGSFWWMPFVLWCISIILLVFVLLPPQVPGPQERAASVEGRLSQRTPLQVQLPCVRRRLFHHRRVARRVCANRVC